MTIHEVEVQEVKKGIANVDKAMVEASMELEKGLTTHEDEAHS